MSIEIHVTQAIDSNVYGHEASTHCPLGESCKIIGDKHYPQLQGSTSPDDGACKPGEIVPLDELAYYIVFREDYCSSWQFVIDMEGESFSCSERGDAERAMATYESLNDDSRRYQYKVILI